MPKQAYTYPCFAIADSTGKDCGNGNNHDADHRYRAWRFFLCHKHNEEKYIKRAKDRIDRG